MRLDRLGSIFALLTVASAASGCGSSAGTTTAPSPLTRCTVTVGAAASEIQAQGGSGTVRVAAARECQWAASVEGGWLSITNGASGQGDGTVEFTAAANADPAARRGAVIVNGQRAELSQAGAACTFTLSAASSAFPQTGGSGQVEVRASSALCGWTASSGADWISVRRSSGQGTGEVAFDVQPTTGPPRSATLVIAGQAYSVTQAPGCNYSISPSSHQAPSAGGGGTIAVATAAGCPWTASSTAPWLRFVQREGSGPGSVSFTIEALSGPERTSTAVVAGQPFIVRQSGQVPECNYSVDAATHSIGASGGDLVVGVTALGSCAWTASSSEPWITIQGPATRAGSGSVTLTVGPTNGPSRTGTVLIAGLLVTVTQAAACTYAISPESASVSAAGGTGTITVTTSSGCEWTATSSAPWLSVTAGATGSGSGQVQYSAGATPGEARAATITIGGRTFTLTQGQGCTYSLSAASTTLPPSGGTGTVNVSAPNQCAWTATSDAGWLTITSGGTGSGNGTVAFAAGAHSGSARSAGLTIAGIAFTVSQGGACAFTIAPDQTAVEAAGGTRTVSITGTDGCGWSASSSAPWIRIASAASGTGNGTVQLAIDPNAGPSRTGTASIAGLTFTVTQANGCTYALAPASFNAPAAGSTVPVTITATAACSWNATTNAPWLSVTGPSEGVGNGSVQVSVQANTTPARSGTVTIAGQPFTVSQASGCTIALSQTLRQVPRNGGTRSVDVIAGAGCAWTAVSQVPWIAITVGASGTGNGIVEFSVEANSTPSSRTGTIIIGAAVLTVEQQ